MKIWLRNAVKYGNCACSYANLQIFYIFALRMEIVTTFQHEAVVTISSRNTKIYKICKLRKEKFCTLYNISQPNRYGSFTNFINSSFQLW